MAAVIYGLYLWDVKTVDKKKASDAESRPLLPGLQPVRVEKIDIVYPEGIIRAQRSGDGWRLIHPIQYPAEDLKIDNFLDYLSKLERGVFLSSSEIAEEEGGIEAFGLGDNAPSITLYQPKYSCELRVGEKTVIGDQLYIQVVGEGGVFFMPAAFLDKLPRSADDWRSRTLVPVERLEFDWIEVNAAPPNGFRVRRSPTNHMWTLVIQPPARANNVKVEALIQGMSKWKVEKFVVVGGNPDLSKYGLADPRTRLVLGAGTNELYALEFGNAAENPDNVYAMMLPRSNVVEVSGELLEKLSVPATEFRNPWLYSGPLETVDRIQVNAREEFVMESSGSERWRMVEPEEFEVDPELANNFLDGLGSLEVAVEKDIVTDYSTYGLEEPAREYVLQSRQPGSDSSTNSPVTIVEFAFGETNKSGRIYLRRRDETSVYSAAVEEVSSLPVASFQLRDKSVWRFNPTNAASLTIAHRDETNTVLRTSEGWDLAGVPVVLSEPVRSEIGEILYRLSRLRVESWIDQGTNGLTLYGFNGTQLSVSVSGTWNGGEQRRELNFGYWTPDQKVLASTVIQGKCLIFEIPAPLCHLVLDLGRNLADIKKNRS